MNRRTLFAIVILLITINFAACSPPPEKARVTQVIDGDTIVIDSGHTVRYIGIDTPEVHPVPEAYGREAWLANIRMVEGKEVRLERDVTETDKYGRLLRYVYVDDTLVNAELVRLGLAVAKAYPPDTRHQENLEQLEEEAREASRGLWAKERGVSH